MQAFVSGLVENRALMIVAAAVAFLLPVADVLEDKGQAVLQSLPPQERAFALEVLRQFESADAQESPSLANPTFPPPETALRGRR